jgi:hypothetical protein
MRVSWPLVGVCLLRLAPPLRGSTHSLCLLCACTLQTNAKMAAMADAQKQQAK